MRVMNKPAALAATTLAATTLLLSGATATATPETPPGTKPTAASGKYLGDGISIRQHPNTNSAVNGYGYRAHAVRIHCYTSQSDGSWFYSTNHTNGVTGWTTSKYLRALSTIHHC